MFTGKGGVGKTTISLAFARYLQKQGLKALYCPFNQDFDPLVWGKENYLRLDKKSSMENYIARRLSSKMVASWVMKSSFFSSMTDMLPNLSYLILMGDLLDKLKNDPELILVMDFPSTGHTITLFESLANFQDIFGIGMIVEDIKKMYHTMAAENFLKLFIISLPAPMVFHEAMELKNHLQKSFIKNSNLIMNSTLSHIPGLQKKDFPAFFKSKLASEEEILHKYKKEFHSILYYVDQAEESLVVDRLIPLMAGIL